MLKIGLIREGKIPSDARVSLSPEQCVLVQQQFGVQIAVQPSTVRCFRDAEYLAHGIELQEDLSDCDLLLGVKEVPIKDLIPDKTYLFFSHTIKKQAYNRKLLQAVLDKHIRLIDYEVLTDGRGDRLVAFGFYAGIVGAYNGIWAFGRRSQRFDLPRMYQCHDYAEVLEAARAIELPPMRIVLTGSGRVAAGAIRLLHDLGIHAVSPLDFLKKDYNKPVYTQLFAQDYVQHRLGPRIFDKAHFYAHGDEYRCVFEPYTHKANLFVNAIFYDPKAPAFFTAEEMRQPNFRIEVIADISCDIAPDASVPVTIRPSTISEPVYGIDRSACTETAPFQRNSVDVMAVDNLPSELPRDASAFFGKQLMDNILPEMLHVEDSRIIREATIAADGCLLEKYAYLNDFVAEQV